MKMGSFPANEVYGQGLMTVSGGEFCRNTIQPCKKMCSFDRHLFTFLLVPASINAFQCMENPRWVERKVFKGCDYVACE